MTHVRDNARLYFFGALGGLLFGYDTGVIAAVAFVFVKLKVPETKGKSLEEIEAGLARDTQTATA